MSALIAGIGTVSALGSGLESLKNGLEGQPRPSIQAQSISGFTMPVYTAQLSGLDRFVPRAALRRMDRFPQMALLASCLAVENSGLKFEDSSRVGIVFGSAYGPTQTTFKFLDGAIDFGDKCASPTLFATSVHNSLASLVSMSLGITGPALTLTCFRRTAGAVLLTAELWLKENTVDYVLAGLGDEFCAVQGYATHSLAGQASSTVRPFEFNECSYVPGEGFVCFLLARNAKDYYARLSAADAQKFVFLAANGERVSGRAYQALMDPEKEIRAYSPLYGSMPLGIAFDMAIAALAIKEGKVYPNPGSGRAAIPMEAGEGIACVSCQGDPVRREQFFLAR